jgi:hypothetical protein
MAMSAARVQHMAMKAEKVLDPRTFDRFDDTNSDEQSPSPQRYERDSFVAPRAREKDYIKARNKILTAMNQVPDTIHYDYEGPRKTGTLYVGNLEFSTSLADLGNELERHLDKIRIEDIIIPKVNGRSKYGFLKISFADAVSFKHADLCDMFSGRIQVKGRSIYLRPLRDKAGSQ